MKRNDEEKRRLIRLIRLLLKHDVLFSDDVSFGICYYCNSNHISLKEYKHLFSKKELKFIKKLYDLS